MKKKFIKTSVVHQDIGEHKHEMWIWDSYEIYATCKKCGMHDWGLPEEGKDTDDFSHDEIIGYFKRKYPTAEVKSLE